MKSGNICVVQCCRVGEIELVNIPKVSVAVYESDNKGLTGTFWPTGNPITEEIHISQILASCKKLGTKGLYRSLPPDVIAAVRSTLRLEEKKAVEESIIIHRAVAKSDEELRARVSSSKLYFPSAGLIRSDGNCLPDSVAVHLGSRTSASAKGNTASQQVRNDIVDWLLKNAEFQLAPGLTMQSMVPRGSSWAAFCARMRKSKEWMEGPCLPAIAELYQKEVFVIHSASYDDQPLKFTPKGGKRPQRWDFAWWCDRHFSSLHKSPYGNLLSFEYY